MNKSLLVLTGHGDKNIILRTSSHRKHSGAAKQRHRKRKGAKVIETSEVSNEQLPQPTITPGAVTLSGGPCERDGLLHSASVPVANNLALCPVSYSCADDADDDADADADADVLQRSTPYFVYVHNHIKVNLVRQSCRVFVYEDDFPSCPSGTALFDRSIQSSSNALHEREAGRCIRKVAPPVPRVSVRHLGISCEIVEDNCRG